MSRFPHVEIHGADEGVTLSSALASSVVASLAMLLFWMCASAISATGFWTPPELAAAAFFGPGALLAGAGAVATGIALHLGLSVAWGVLHASTLRSSRRAWPAGLAVGLAYGGCLFLVMYYVVAPWGDPTLFVQAPPVELFLANLVFGAVLGVWSPLLRAVGPGPRLVTVGRSWPPG